MVFWAHMELIKKYWVWGVAILIIIIGGYMLSQKTAQAPGLDTTTLFTPNATTTTSVASTTSSTQKQFPVDKADTIASWNFTGTHTGNITLKTQATADVQKLTDLLGKGSYEDYDLYNGIANDYTALGDGTMAYHYYNLAVAIHPTKGLAYMNLGHLFDLLGAENTAVNAYAKSVAVEPNQNAYWLAYLNFLANTQPKSTLTASVFASAISTTNADPDILISEANWLESIGRISDAIAAWKKVRVSVGLDQQKAIDTKISKLQAKL